MSGETEGERWRPCSACKKPIAYGAVHWVCSVSTCNRKRTGLVFCTTDCWEVHLPGARHREAWAVEATAPSRAAAGGDAPDTGAGDERKTGRRRIVPAAAPAKAQPAATEVLIVASRLKDYVRARSGFNTSDGVLEPLSEIVRRACDQAMENAEREGRRTVLERDVPHPDRR